jgi:hypothetical protein
MKDTISGRRAARSKCWLSVQDDGTTRPLTNGFVWGFLGGIVGGLFGVGVRKSNGQGQCVTNNHNLGAAGSAGLSKEGRG